MTAIPKTSLDRLNFCAHNNTVSNNFKHNKWYTLQLIDKLECLNAMLFMFQYKMEHTKPVFKGKILNYFCVSLLSTWDAYIDLDAFWRQTDQWGKGGGWKKGGGRKQRVSEGYSCSCCRMFFLDINRATFPVTHQFTLRIQSSVLSCSFKVNIFSFVIQCDPFCVSVWLFFKNIASLILIQPRKSFKVLFYF